MSVGAVSFCRLEIGVDDCKGGVKVYRAELNRLSKSSLHQMAEANRFVNTFTNDCIEVPKQGKGGKNN